MLRTHCPSHRVASFRPTLEGLEDRIVPAGLDQVTGLVTTIVGDLVTANSLSAKVNADVSAFDQAPNLNNLVALAIDTTRFANAVVHVDVDVLTLNTFVGAANSFGDLPSFVKSGLVSTLNADIAQAQQLNADLFQSFGDLFAAIFSLGAGSASLTPLPSAPVTLDPISVPGAVPGSSGSVTASAIVHNGTDSTVTLSVSGTDGYSNSTTRAGIVGDGAIALTVPAAESGHTYTWTASVSGGPSEQATTVFN